MCAVHGDSFSGATVYCVQQFCDYLVVLGEEWRLSPPRLLTCNAIWWTAWELHTSPCCCTIVHCNTSLLNCMEPSSVLSDRDRDRETKRGSGFMPWLSDKSVSLSSFCSFVFLPFFAMLCIFVCIFSICQCDWNLSVQMDRWLRISLCINGETLLQCIRVQIRSLQCLGFLAFFSSKQ